MAKQIDNKPAGLKKRQTFSFAAPTATSVQLVGDFTNWQQRPITMQKGVGGIWSATAELEVGEHHYRFLVDGQWRDDPECSMHMPNAFGSQNMIRRVQ